MSNASQNPADGQFDDSSPWSPFLDHYLTPGEIEEAFDEANAEAEFAAWQVQDDRDEAAFLKWIEERGQPA